MNGLIKGIAAVAALAGVGYIGYRQGTKVMDNLTKVNLHRSTGRYGDPMDPKTYESGKKEV